MIIFYFKLGVTSTDTPALRQAVTLRNGHLKPQFHCILLGYPISKGPF